jgi:DNA-binding NtrC family response regulator
MLLSGPTLFAFVDLKDPFMAGPVAGEDRAGPILSLLDARPCGWLHLFHTPHTRENAERTCQEVRKRYPPCQVQVHELPVSDPKDYSQVMGLLAREIRTVVRQRPSEHLVCVSSGTAEMRAALFLLTAVGVLPATLLQVGSPAQPLYGAANVKEVDLGSPDWSALRDLVMPSSYGRGDDVGAVLPDLDSLEPPSPAGPARVAMRRPAMAYAAALRPPRRELPGLEDALKELGIFVGSAVFQQAVDRAAIVAPAAVPVLLQGETGTGKEVVAQLIHRLGGERGRPFVAVNCAAVPKDLAESYLFGHVQGAFTGAVRDQAGKFVEADGGTLFLDEIGELTLEIQAKLLRVLQDGQVTPLGATRVQNVNVRIVAATNRKLDQEIVAGRFREDLYYRLNLALIEIPPLRERGVEEIRTLTLRFLEDINRRRPAPVQISKEALRRLETHHWPGNVRDLKNALERSVLFAVGDVLGPEDILIQIQPQADPLAGLPEPGPGFSLEGFLAAARKQLFLRALEKSNGNQSQAAEKLGITRQAVSEFVKNHVNPR